MTLRKTEEIFGLILVVNLKPDERKKEKDDFFESPKKKKLGPQFGLKIRGGGPPDPSPGFATAYDLLVTSPDTLALNSSTELQENHRSCLQVSGSTPPNLN